LTSAMAGRIGEWLPFHAGCCYAADERALAERVENEHGQHNKQRGSHEQVPVGCPHSSTLCTGGSCGIQSVSIQDGWLLRAILLSFGVTNAGLGLLMEIRWES